MKIGVLTFWWSYDNYGQLLQCYALQKYLRDLGHEVFLIRYDFFSDVGSSCVIRCIKRNINRFIKKKINDEREFDLFRSERLNYSKKIYRSFRELQRNPPEADIYIVGSDQVWSCIMSPLNNYKNITKTYFLDFGKNNVKRISYAASWGTTKIRKEYIDFITPLLEKFDSVSVREETGIELCRECGCYSAVLVPDPTFLISKNEYLEDLCITDSTEKEKYVFLYLLNNEFDFNIETIFEWAVSKGLKVKYVTGNGMKDNYEKDNCTISNWISYINNAEYVITNSFHCSVFSIIMNKKFGVVPLSGSHLGMNSRICSLFELCNIENRFLTNSFNVLDKEYACNIDSIKKLAVDYLREVIV